MRRLWDSLRPGPGGPSYAWRTLPRNGSEEGRPALLGGPSSREDVDGAVAPHLFADSRRVLCQILRSTSTSRV